MSGLIASMLSGAAVGGGGAVEDYYTTQYKKEAQIDLAKERATIEHNKRMALAKYKAGRDDDREERRSENNQALSDTEFSRGLARDRIKAGDNDARVNRQIEARESSDDRADTRSDKDRKSRERIAANRAKKAKTTLQVGKDSIVREISNGRAKPVIDESTGKPLEAPRGVTKANLEIAGSHFDAAKEMARNNEDPKEIEAEREKGRALLRSQNGRGNAGGQTKRSFPRPPKAAIEMLQAEPNRANKFTSKEERADQFITKYGEQAYESLSGESIFKRNMMRDVKPSTNINDIRERGLGTRSVTGSIR